MNRRRFVVISASIGAAAAAGCSGRFGGPVSELEPLLSGRAPGPQYRLKAQYATTVIGGKSFRTRTYGGRIPGPTIVTRPGATLNVEVDNYLPRNPKAPCPKGPMMVPDIRDEMETMNNPNPKRYRRATGPFDCMNNPHDFNTTNLHTHGIQTTPHLFDPIGTSDPMAPMLGVEPGKKFRYQLPIPTDHPSGLHWYHPHHHGATDVQVSGGMAGLIVCRGPIDEVPEIAAARELFLVMQSIQVNKNKKRRNLYDLEYEAYKPPDQGGYFVDTEYTMYTVATDGAGGRKDAAGVMWQDDTGPKPVFSPMPPPTFTMAPGEVIRLRLLNGCNQHTLPLILPGMEAWQIGFDGVNLLEPSLKDMSGDVKGGALTVENFIEAPVRMTMPGNRIEFLIKAPDTPGKTYTLSSMDANDLHGPATKIDWLTFVVTGAKKSMGIPKKLPKPEREYPLIGPGKTPRTFTFSFKADDQHETILTGFKFLVNDELYKEMEVPTTVHLNHEEEWTIENASGSPHPFHVHVNSFQLVAINDVPNDPVEIWDTFYVPPKRSRKDGKNGSITIRIRFLDFKGKSVHHCHFLSHEDTGMMQNFLIE
jgi:FtsP/CotA-like multicopper oxidase with cupredoxin domain